MVVRGAQYIKIDVMVGDAGSGHKHERLRLLGEYASCPEHTNQRSATGRDPLFPRRTEARAHNNHTWFRSPTSRITMESIAGHSSRRPRCSLPMQARHNCCPRHQGGPPYPWRPKNRRGTYQQGHKKENEPRHGNQPILTRSGECQTARSTRGTASLAVAPAVQGPTAAPRGWGGKQPRPSHPRRP